MVEISGCHKCKIKPTVGGHYVALCSVHAAAPALLEALEAFIDYHDDEIHIRREFMAVLDKARAAIRAAKGEPA